MTGALTFRGWLVGQGHRDDPVGDLARDHRACRFTDAPGFARHLVAEHDADSPDLAAFRAASKAYRAYARSRSGAASIARRGTTPPAEVGGRGATDRNRRA